MQSLAGNCMKNIYLLFIILILVTGVTELKAQESDTLSSNSEVFYQQISAILLNTPSKTFQNRSEELLERFYQRWSIGRFNSAEKEEIRNLVEKMRQKKMRTFPYLFDYIYTITLFSESNQLPKSIISWHAYASKLLDEKKSTPFGDFLEFTNGLLEHNLFHEKGSLEWYYTGFRFNFFTDTSFLVKFNNGDLIGKSRKDSTVILKTDGVYNYDYGLWYGDSGKLEWTRFGEDYKKEIYALFNKYEIDLNSSNFVIDSADLYYKRFFNTPVKGSLTERISSSRPNERTSYPRFIAYYDEFELDNIYPEISYFGGAELEGLDLYGTGGIKSKAVIKMTRSDTIYAMIKAEKFRLEPERFISSDAEFVFYFDIDSLYHPSLHVNYVNDDRQFVMFTESSGTDGTPFFDSYHELDIYVQAMFWKMDEPDLHFKRVRNVKNRNLALIVSSNYFNQKDFYRIQGIDDVNPFYVIYNYMYSYGVDEIQLNALASFMEKPSEQVSALLIDLSNKGFLVYNSRTETAVVKDRFRYFLQAKGGEIDYDVIKLQSSVDTKSNAIINLNTLNLDVNGVPEVSISDSQEVFIYPYDKTISFKKNRDFTFDGQVHMGLLDFYSRNSAFIYDSFMLKMNYVDSLAFQVYYVDSTGTSDSLVKVKNVIEDMVGTVYIDHPDNKSGLQQFLEYPKFVSTDVSYVYFNERKIQDSTLYPENFYYSVDPFLFDSISTFTTEGLEFEGSLTSAGIFPIIKQPLVVMPDYSLGFTHTTPPKGYDMYGGLGRYRNHISLSNEGFLGEGNIDYLSSSSSSDNFIFYPDSVTGVSYDFTVMQSPQEYNFPSAQGDTVLIQWAIDTNVMMLTSKNSPFIVYDNSWLDGVMSLNPSYMKGKGEYTFDQSKIVSDNIDFSYSSLTADTSDFYLKNSHNDSLVFRAMDYFSRIDFEKQSGWFSSINDSSFTEFPFNNYVSTLDEVEWVMQEDILKLSSDQSAEYSAIDTLNMDQLIDYDLYGPEFISVNEHQDSLRFYAGRAIYDLYNYSIDIEQVRLIKVADVAVFPAGERVSILRGAKMKTLNSAQIIADRVNKWHNIYNSEVKIYSRNHYTASGWIDFTDRLGAKQPVYLSTIAADSMGGTTAYGSIPADELFFLGPEYFYKGNVVLKGSRENLRFNGEYKLNEECVGTPDNWVDVNKIIDPDNILFDINDSTKNAMGQVSYFGLGYSDYYSRYYPLVIEPLKSGEDTLLITATGELGVDTASNGFYVGRSPDQTINQQNFVELETRTCTMFGDGIFNLDLDINMMIVKNAGEFKHIIINDSTYLDMSLLLDFYFDDKALEMMSDSMKVSNLRSCSLMESNFPLYLRKQMPHDAPGMLNDITLYGQLKKMPDELTNKFIFSDVTFFWDSFSRSYISKGKIGVGYVNGDIMNAWVDGWVQIEKGRTGSEISILLQPTAKSWYYFNYKNGILQTLSSDDLYNQRIESIKQEKRVLNENSETDYYEYVISTKRSMIDFKRRMEKAAVR